MPRPQARSFAQPDEVRSMPGFRVETVGLGEATIGHCSFDPGWRWSTSLGPIVGTPSCPILLGFNAPPPIAAGTWTYALVDPHGFVLATGNLIVQALKASASVSDDYYGFGARYGADRSIEPTNSGSRLW